MDSAPIGGNAENVWFRRLIEAERRDLGGCTTTAHFLYEGFRGTVNNSDAGALLR